MSPSHGHLGRDVVVDVADQPADHDRLAVADHDGVLDLAARERDADLVDVADAGCSSLLMPVISWKMSRRRLSPSVICGVTRSVTPMSWRSTLTEVERPVGGGGARRRRRLHAAA